MNKIRKINNIVSTILLNLCFIYLIITLGPRLLGYEVNVVLSNSMEPVYSTGELLLVKPAKADEIKVNDIISFKGSGVSGNVITHRVIKIDQEKQVFITKGDANSSQDSNPVAFSRLNGIVKINIPYIGYIYGMIQSMIVKIILAGLVLIYIIVNLVTKKKLNSNVSEEEAK